MPETTPYTHKVRLCRLKASESSPAPVDVEYHVNAASKRDAALKALDMAKREYPGNQFTCHSDSDVFLLL